MPESPIAERLQKVQARIGNAAGRAGRNPAEISLVAVAKTFSADVVLEAIAAGATDIGENRAQEFRDKHQLIGDRARWHFVGSLQSNKARYIVGACALIHSVDRYGLAEAISRRAQRLGITQDVLVEVNVAGELSKSGVEPARAPPLAAEVDGLPGVAVKGVMTIPPQPATPEDSRPYFKELRRIAEDVAARVPGAVEISMGMTGDFEIAVEEGATIVRVGEAIFGPRRQA
jgi:pyridoxal phosphate enzyme (YggS family)